MVKIICTENGDNNRTEIALGGDMDLVVSQIGYAVKTIYTNVREQDKNAAEEFRVADPRNRKQGYADVEHGAVRGRNARCSTRPQGREADRR